MKQVTCILLALLWCNQFAVGQTVANPAEQIISAENYFAFLVKDKGIKKAFLLASDENTIIFRPEPVKAETFFKAKDNVPGLLSWQPTYAKICKSNDWGFSTGPYTFKASDTSSVVNYGDYFSIWKKNKKGVWHLAVDGGISHPKPEVITPTEIHNPTSNKFLHQKSQQRLAQRNDLVLSNDKLFSTILNRENKTAYTEFLSENVRLLFPGHEPLLGKQTVLSFQQNRQYKIINSKPLSADRSYSGELAYTMGTADIVQNGQTKKCNYVRIWEVQPGWKWNIILECYLPAE